MTDERKETVADVLAEMREPSDDPRWLYDQAHVDSYANRIEAAYARERSEWWDARHAALGNRVQELLAQIAEKDASLIGAARQISANAEELKRLDAEIAELKARARALRPCDCDRHSGGGSDVILVCHDCGGYFP